MSAEPVVGNWKLVSWQVVTEDGAKDLHRRWRVFFLLAACSRPPIWRLRVPLKKFTPSRNALPVSD
jgi:hypothetical protein